MVENEGVRFQLFGGFQAFRDGRDVELPGMSPGTYLRMLILSGGLFLDSGEGVDLGEEGSFADSVNKANRPMKAGQFGRYDFTNRTGLELRYRKGAGICLEGGPYSSDIADFEDVWRRRTAATDDELVSAINLYGNGLLVESWPKTKVFKDNVAWIQKRAAELQAFREDIVAEIKARSEATEGNQSEWAGQSPELKEETKSLDEISGFAKRLAEPESAVESSTSLGEELCQLSGAETQDPATDKTPFALDDPWVLTWLYQEGGQDIDQQKMDSLRATYQIKTDDDALDVLEQAGHYAREMFACDPQRGGGVFVESQLDRIARFGRRLLFFLRKDDLDPSLSVAWQAMSDSYHVKGQRHETWFTTVGREQKRRETTRSESTSGLLSFGEKRFIRACAIRACRSLEPRVKQLRDNQKRAEENRNLFYRPIYEGEIDRMIALVLGVVHLQGYRIVELQKVETRRGGIDPRSLTLRPGESLEDRRTRASKQAWEVNVLVDAIAVPDWSKPIAPSLYSEHSRLLQRWAEERGRIAEKQRRKREARESLPTDKPLSFQNRRGQTLILRAMSVLSSWLTIIGVGVFIGMQIESAQVLLSRSISLTQIGQCVLFVALAGWPIWIPMSNAFFKAFSNAALDGTVRSAFGFWTLLLACSLGYLLYLAATQL